MKKKYDLSERLEDFTSNIVRLYDHKPKSFASEYLAKQLIRSSCSAALNYGEVLGTVTAKDKVFKLSICLKEMRESHSNLKIQLKAKLIDKEILEPYIIETDELIRIIVTLIKKQ